MGAKAEVRRLREEVDLLRTQLLLAQEQQSPAPERKRPRTVASLRRRYGVHARPLLALGALHAAGAAAHGGGLGAWAAAAGLGTGLTWWALRGRRRLDRTAERGYALASWAAASTWLGAAGAAGAGAVDTWLWACGGTWSVPWWVHHRTRPRTGEATSLEWAEELRQAWHERVARPGGPLPGSRLLEPRRLPGGWEATIEVADGSSDDAIARIKQIGARLKLRLDEINIEPHPGGLHLARLLVQRDNPLTQVHHWCSPTLDRATGVSTIGLYADLRLVPYRHWRPGSGPVHTLIAGCTDSGKSTLVTMLLAEERHSGLVVSWLIDPQRGQSYPGWKRSVHRFAGSISEARELLTELRRRMYGRNAYLSQIVWKDHKGRQIEGVESFTPGDPRHSLPLISVTIDEAQRVLADEVCGAIVAELIMMSRKCGIKFRLVTQVPLLGSLGDSQDIKDAVAAGNVIVLRTANPLTGQVAFNGAMPVDPCELPKEWPDGSSTSGLGFVFAPGADRPTTMRTFLVDDPYHWATTGTPAVEDDVIEPEPQPEPEPGPAVPAFTVITQEEDVPDTRLARDRVLEFFADGQPHTPVEAKRHFHDRGIAPRTVHLALRQLVESGLLEQPKERGPYRITSAGHAHLARQNAVA